MISCKNVASLLLSDELHAQSRWKRMEVRVHLTMCGLCSRLARQIDQMRSGARKMSAQDEASPDLEERLLRRLLGK